MPQKTKKIVVIGGGAAGLLAAGKAAESGAETMLLEKMRRPGLKLRITGKGRCNITNVAELGEFIGHFGKNGKFLRQAFHNLSNTDLMSFFTQNGLKLVTERGGRVFPENGKATEVLSVLLKWVESAGVKIRYDAPVSKIIVDHGVITGVITKGKTIQCNAVILATGGASYPATGSSGDGYRLAEELTHSITPVRPALVPLKTDHASTGKMDGLSLRNVNVRMFVDGKKKSTAFGELLFTKFGVSGPVILSLSGEAVDANREGRVVELAIDWKSALDEKKLDARILRDIAKRHQETMDVFLRCLLPKEAVPVCLDSTSIPADRVAGQLTAKERRRLKMWLKEFRITVCGYRPIDEAIITAGGIATKEIDPRTMESKFVKGLYIVGEVLDIQADTGGYNLQAAFSTGWLAGRCAAQENP